MFLYPWDKLMGGEADPVLEGSEARCETRWSPGEGQRPAEAEHPSLGRVCLPQTGCARTPSTVSLQAPLLRLLCMAASPPSVSGLQLGFVLLVLQLLVCNKITMSAPPMDCWVT